MITPEKIFKKIVKETTNADKLQLSALFLL